ncbi:MAG TPA: ribosome small subunit-dependent GTPase A [Spirochaetaceae bacterium]|nr:ribosome small subunit-dependent GTPase A [Spirochaetaceae bacterium]
MERVLGEIVLISSTSFQARVDGRIVNAVIKGKRLKGQEDVRFELWDKKKVFFDNSLCVGDVVRLEFESESWKITERQQRESSFVRYNFIKRKLQTIGSNFDMLCIIAPHNSPAMNSFFVNTTLMGLDGKCRIVFVFTKSDLEFSKDDENVIDAIDTAGFESVRVSSKSGDNISVLREMVESRTALFVGESGSGKSTLLNALFCKDMQMVGELSKKGNVGCHTTTSSVLLSDEKLRIIDTPGIRFVRPLSLKWDGVIACFPEFSKFQCRYADCKHIGESGCKADEAAGRGIISQVRLSDYRRMMETNDGKI